MSHNFFFLCLVIFTCASYNISGQDNPTSSLDSVYIDKGYIALSSNLDSALMLFNLAESIAKGNENWDHYVDCYNGRAFYYYIKEDLLNFKKEVYNAVDLAETHLDSSHKIYSVALNNLGVFLSDKDYNKAINHLTQSLDIDIKNNADKLSVAESYHNIAVVYRNMGDYEEGINYENKARRLRIDSLGVDSYPVALSEQAIAHLYRDKKELNIALTYYNNFLKTISPKDFKIKPRLRDIIYCYQSISEIYIEKRQYDKAYLNIKKAIDLQSDSNAPRKIQSFEILGDWYLNQSQYDNAVQSYQRSKDAAKNTFQAFDKHILFARTSKNIANAHLKKGAYNEALKHYQTALIKLSLEFENNSIETNPTVDQFISVIEGLQITKGKANTFLKKYNFENNLDDLKLAFENYKFAAEIIQSLRQSFLAAGSKNELAEQSIEVFEKAIKTSILLFEKTKDKKYLASAFQYAEQNKSRLMEELLQEDYAQIAGGLPSFELEKEQELSRDRNFYQNKINEEKSKTADIDEEKIKLWENARFNLNNEYNDLINRFEKEYPQYYDLKYVTKNIDLKKIRENILNEENALLEYFVGVDKIYLFSVTKNNLEVFEFDKSPNFAEDISALLTIINQSPFEDKNGISENRKRFSELSHRIYNSYLEPAINALPKETKHLIIIPDDVFAFIPFDILLTKETKAAVKDYSLNSFEYLIEQYTISTNYSVSLLVNHSEPNTSTDLIPFLGFAPTFGERITDNRSCSNDEVYTLQCNVNEVVSINNIFKGQINDGLDANSDAFKTQAAQSRILHLATHACVDEENPDLNKIYFSDNYLTGTDLKNLKLNAELAVLSACNTGSGKLVKGEGVMSLSRGFILAGCPSTLMSLWSVDDCTTSEIMVRFYKNIKAGMTKDEALRQSKLDHLASADQVNSHPYYWAAFVQSGNADAMEFPNGFPRYFYILALVLVFVVVFYFIKNRKPL